ncbi:MAG: amidohydrolase [Dehalococcoidia bacterium]
MDTAPSESLKAQVASAVERRADELISLSHAIHADPEVAFQEVRAAERLTRLLEGAGFSVTRGVAGLPTAFRAEIGEGDPAIAICAEYDALPELGHGCGHNVIATAAIGAGVALAAIAARLPGRVVVIGTPAEEGGGGKLILLDHGVFRGIDAAMMIHPATRNLVDRGSLDSTRVEVGYRGEAVHADTPHGSGANPLDAILQLFSGANVMRAGMLPSARLHGIVVEGGESPTLIPGYAGARFSVRAADRQYAATLIERFRRVAEAAAAAAGVEVVIDVGRSYENMVPNLAIARAFGQNLTALGRRVSPTTGNERMGSTDMGNVSQQLPAIHAYLAIADEGVSGHSLRFRDAAGSPRGDQGALDGANALAMTVVDLLTDPNLLGRVRAEFADQRAAGRVRGMPEV